MTNTEKVAAMIAWLKEHQNDFPKSFKLAQAMTVCDSRLFVEVLIARIEAYVERNLLGGCFKASYLKAYQLKQWYEQNIPNATTTVPLLLEDEPLEQERQTIIPPYEPTTTTTDTVESRPREPASDGLFIEA